MTCIQKGIQSAPTTFRNGSLAGFKLRLARSNLRGGVRTLVQRLAMEATESAPLTPPEACAQPDPVQPQQPEQPEQPEQPQGAPSTDGSAA